MKAQRRQDTDITKTPSLQNPLLGSAAQKGSSTLCAYSRHWERGPLQRRAGVSQQIFSKGPGSKYFRICSLLHSG